MLEPDIKTHKDIIHFFNTVMMILSKTRNFIDGFNPNDPYSVTITRSTLRLLEGYNAYIGALNDFIESFVKVLNHTGSDCVDMVLKTPAQRSFVERGFEFSPIDLSIFTIHEDVLAHLASDDK